MSDFDYKQLTGLSLAELLKQDKSLLKAFSVRSGYKFSQWFIDHLGV